MQEDTPVPEAPQQPVDLTQSEILACGPSEHVGCILNLVTTPEGGATELDDNGFVTWAAASSQVERDTPDSPQHAD